MKTPASPKILTSYLVAEAYSLSAKDTNLKKSKEHIDNLEVSYMVLLRQELLMANCSGVFIALNTSIYSNLENSREGVYVQHSSPDTASNTLILYHGNPDIAAEKGIMPHRKRHLEFDKSAFPGYDNILNSNEEQLGYACRITDVITLPRTSERVMLAVLPVRESRNDKRLKRRNVLWRGLPTGV